MKLFLGLLTILWTLFNFTSADYISIDYIQGKENYQPATYIYNKCIGKNLPSLQGNYSCLEMVKTFTTENAMWNPILKSPTNDYGICQLHYPIHKPFILSELFTNTNTQLDYCLSVWINASVQKTMPRYANKKYDYKNSKKKNIRLNSLRNNVQLHTEKKDIVVNLTPEKRLFISLMKRTYTRANT